MKTYKKKKKLRAEADKLWFQQYLKDRCEICGSTYRLTGHHFYYRSSYGHLRYDKDNHITLCRSCHFQLHSGGDPKKVEGKIKEAKGEEWYDRLTKKSRNRPKGTYKGIKWYNKKIKELKEDGGQD